MMEFFNKEIKPASDKLEEMLSKVIIEKRITDMSIYGIIGNNQWDGSVIIKNGNSINVYGKYFSTRERAEIYADKLLKELA